MTSKPVKLTIEVSARTYRRVRALLRWLSDHPEGRHADIRGLSELIEQALINETRRMEQQHNEGKPFPPDDTPIRRGPRGRRPGERDRWAEQRWDDPDTTA